MVEDENLQLLPTFRIGVTLSISFMSYPLKGSLLVS